jgi:hypothetical protein
MRHGVLAIALIGSLAMISGCYGYGTYGAGVPVGAEVDLGVPVVQAGVVPTDIYTYPRVYYRGSYAYFVDGRWYYPMPRRGWVIMREEPRELARYRSTYIRRPAPGYAFPPRRPAPGYAYPPERRMYRRYYP